MPQKAGRKLAEAVRKQIERIPYFCSVENVSPNLAVHEMPYGGGREGAL